MPLETLRRVQKVTQKTLEHNLGPKSGFSRDFSLVSVQGVPDTAEGTSDQLKLVESMLAKLRGLKRKLSDLAQEQMVAEATTRARVEYLQALPASRDDGEYPAWANRRLAHHLTDYFLRSDPPLKQSARALAQEQGIQDLVDYDVLDELAKVETGLRARRLDEVLIWVGENRSALRKAKVESSFPRLIQVKVGR